VTFSSYDVPTLISAGVAAALPTWDNDGSGGGTFYWPLANLRQGIIEPILGGLGPIRAFPPLLLGAP
jgi:hypothetical protein